MSLQIGDIYLTLDAQIINECRQQWRNKESFIRLTIDVEEDIVAIQIARAQRDRDFFKRIPGSHRVLRRWRPVAAGRLDRDLLIDPRRGIA